MTFRLKSFYFQYKRAEGGVFRWVRHAATTQQLPNTCSGYKAQVQSIKIETPGHILRNLARVIAIRQKCARFYIGKRDKDTQREAAIRSHLHWIKFLNEIYRMLATSKSNNPAQAATGETKKDSKPINLPRNTCSINSFEMLEVHVIMEGLEEESPPKEVLARPESDPPIPEEAEDKYFELWCHQEFLQSSRDGLKRMLDNVKVSKGSIDAAGLIVHTVLQHVIQTDHDFGIRHPQFTNHKMVCEASNISVASLGMPLDEEGKSLTATEKAQVAESGCNSIQLWLYAHHLPKSGKTALKCLPQISWCAVVARYMPEVMKLSSPRISTSHHFMPLTLISLALKARNYPSCVPFIVEVLEHVHRTFGQCGKLLYTTLERLVTNMERYLDITDKIEGDMKVTRKSLEPDIKAAAELLKTSSPQELEFRQSMVVALGTMIRHISLDTYQLGLVINSCEATLLSVAHLYCAAKSHDLLSETWPDMEHFLGTYATGKVNPKGKSYCLTYRSRCPPKSIWSSFLLGIGVPFGQISRNILPNDLEKLRNKEYTIAPTSMVVAEIFCQEDIEKRAGSEADGADMLDMYYRLTGSKTPCVNELLAKMVEFEKQQDELIHFDTVPMFVLADENIATSTKTSLEVVGEILKSFAATEDSSRLRAFWANLTPHIREHGRDGLKGLEAWKEISSLYGSGSEKQNVAEKQATEWVLQILRGEQSKLPDYMEKYLLDL
ncbi:hypothetical protein D6D12_09904 [Aureobasidium pullulans]|uniref:DUF6604 domain-containing protein n=1 Tax=Aureobasidium pullulans TaxID=5580 RepID=A0AB74JFF2_AURPU|nr:hypothetical protein D6D12_09904 [Aureobasidium pullulans]THX51187.1 hypothetical protein D6D11_05115 [Aureobasidium pullulans]